MLKGQVPVGPHEATIIASAPFDVFERVLSIPYVFGGLGHGARQHSSDEYFTVGGLLDFEKSMALMLANYLEEADKKP